MISFFPSTFQTIDPASGELISTESWMIDSDIEVAISEAFKYSKSNKEKSIGARSELLRKMSVELRQAKPILAKQVSLEMGKVFAEAELEIEKSALCCQYFSENLEEFLKDQVIGGTRIVKENLGPILAVMPWNFPVWQLIRVLAPAIGIGNPVILKASEITAGSAKLLQNIFDGVEKGLLFNLRINHEQTAKIIADRRVRAVTLTGSTKAGKQVAELAGRFLKKSVMELGGSDAYVILDDADIEGSAKLCANARMINNGQSCIAAKRFIVPEKSFATFCEAFSIQVRSLKMGSPFDPTVKVGPLAHKRFQEQLIKLCHSLEVEGAQKIFDLDSGQGFDWMAPHAFFPARGYQVTDKMKIPIQEEFFGPVALMYSYTGEDEALEIANQSVFGLGGAVFSKNLDRAQSFAQKMDCGVVGINQSVFSDPKIPFGGTKDSGYGRELGSIGFDEFINVKSILAKS
jgi:succinate-semialdehyde dehydrogenase/glutarate-semialdehyde dehydrogenase